MNTTINSKDYIFWCDVETTGTNENTDLLLQVSAIITDDKNTNDSPFFDEIIYHENSQELRAKSQKIVQSMHDETGLWNKLVNGKPIDEIDSILHNFITTHAKNADSIRLAGSSCRLDLNFIEKYLPKTYSLLTYKFIDVSGMAFVFKSRGIVNGYYPKNKTHNSLDDIKETREELEWLLSHVKN